MTYNESFGQCYYFKYLNYNEEIAYTNSLIYLQFIAKKLESMCMCACAYALVSNADV